MEKAKENMKIVEEKPFDYNFSVENNDEGVPEILGTFETLDEVREYLATNAVFENVDTSAVRFYSDEEIKDFKEKVLDIVENEPQADDDRTDAEANLQQAKKDKEVAWENYNALICEMKDLAREIRVGTTSIKLPSLRTFRIPYKGKFYTYVWLDNEKVVLVDIYYIPENQKQDLFNANEKNEDFFQSLGNENKRQTKQVP